MKIFNGVDELTAAVGTHLGHSDWRTVTQRQIDAFADVTEDRQWIHVDVARASEGPFGSTIAHGFLTLSLVTAMAWEVYAVQGPRMGINYGLNRLRFPAAVRAGARVRACVELMSVTATASGHQVVTRVTVEIDGSSKPACVVDSISLLVTA